MNNRHVTYLAVPHINDRLSINCEVFDMLNKNTYGAKKGEAKQK